MIKWLLTAIAGSVAALFAVAKGADWLIQTLHWDWDAPPNIWLQTVVFFVAYLQLIGWVCWYRTNILCAEVDRCAAAKKLLEEQVLKNRKSSIKKGKR